MKLSQMLAEELQKKIIENEALARALLESNSSLKPVVDEVAKVDPKVAYQEPPKPMDPRRHQELMRRLDLARQAKDAKKQAAEDRRQRMLDNLSKARKAKQKKRKKAGK